MTVSFGVGVLFLFFMGQACSYFRDPFLCIGPVAPDAIKEQMQHTANEKRLTGRAFVGPRD